jgi:hypothetical protein
MHVLQQKEKCMEERQWRWVMHMCITGFANVRRVG